MLRRKKAAACSLPTILLYALHAAASAPVVTVEKVVEAQQTTFIICGFSLPEMRRITLTCTYSVPHASIMDAIVSLPQPATAVSVLVDTAASSLSVSIHAVSTLLLPDNARVLVLKMNEPTGGVAGTLTFVKALVIDKQGASSEPPIVVKSSAAGKSVPAAGRRVAAARTGRVMLFEMNGRRVANSGQRSAPGCYCKSVGRASATGVISVR